MGFKAYALKGSESSLSPETSLKNAAIYTLRRHKWLSVREMTTWLKRYGWIEKGEWLDGSKLYAELRKLANEGKVSIDTSRGRTKYSLEVDF